VDRLQGLRGKYGIASPAPICPPVPSGVEGPGAAEAFVADVLGDPASCQTVFAPDTDGTRLVPDRGEIRLTYGELTALIEAAVRELK
jgi:hypothetical protein